MKKMSLNRAVGICEGTDKPKSREELREAWQMLVETGLAFQMHGAIERKAKRMIEEGLISVGKYNDLFGGHD